MIMLPITMLVIFMILYTMFRSFKWAALILANVAMAPIGGMLALLFTGTHFSVSSGVGFLALFGVSRADRRDHAGVHQSVARARPFDRGRRAVEGAVLRLRPDHDDHAGCHARSAAGGHCRTVSARIRSGPFAIVIVGGLMVAMVMSIFLLPTLYVWIAR